MNAFIVLVDIRYHIKILLAHRPKHAELTIDIDKKLFYKKSEVKNHANYSVSEVQPGHCTNMY